MGGHPAALRRGLACADHRNAALFDRMLEEGGLLLSEFAPGTPPLPENFPIRNRIISGLSLGILVVEAATRSGSLITARTALEQNREVYAVPGPALDEHCCGAQELIRQGARPVFSADDILRDLLERLRPYGIERPVLDEQEMLRTAAGGPPPSEDEYAAAADVREKFMGEGASVYNLGLGSVAL